MPIRDRDERCAYQRRYQKENSKCLWAVKKEKLATQFEVLKEAKNRPCADCNQSYGYWVMDFDHVRGDKKRWNLSRLRAKMVSIQSLESEIAKCDVVCSNCHREREHQRRRIKRQRAQGAEETPNLLLVGSIPTAGAKVRG